MTRYYLTNKAVDDLTNIWDYTLSKWSEYQAEKYYELLVDSLHEITKSPELGKNYDGITPFLFGFHSQRHIIFYRKINTNKTEITRILHDSIDLKNRILE